MLRGLEAWPGGKPTAPQACFVWRPVWDAPPWWVESGGGLIIRTQLDSGSSTQTLSLALKHQH